jgi:uncharacterized protein YfiM (DUF2279 family)
MVCGILALICCTGASVSAQAERFGRDKMLHLTVSASLTVGGYTVLHAFDVADSLALPLAVTATLGVGLGKELFDALDGRSFSPADLAWDVLGVASGLLLTAAIRLAFGAPPAGAPDAATSSSGNSDRMARN